MDSIGIGILGTGWVAAEHIKSYAKSGKAHVAGICGTSVDKARAIAAACGVEDTRIYTSYEDMQADPAIAAISLCTPPDGHPEQVILAANAGKHILIEKAAANDPVSLGRMLRAVETAGVRTVVSFVLRWHPQFEFTRNMLDENAIGNIFFAQVDYWHNIGPQYGQYRWNVKKDVAGSAFLSAGCHAADAIRWFVRDEVTEVTAYSNQINSDYEYPTNVVAILKFANGCIGKLSTSFDIRGPYQFNVDLLGDKGTIRDNRIHAEEYMGITTDWIEEPVIRPDSGDVSHHPFDAEIAHFLECIEQGKESHVNLADAARTHALCYAIDRSAEEGRTVTLSEVDAEIASGRGD